MKHYGDITKINGAEAPVVDVITGGSPCQDLSVAGKRAGLAGERSGLFMEQMRIVKEMRERERATGRTGWMVRPRYMVWENVPGAFSSGNPKGADFGAVIEEIIKVAEPGTSVSVCVPNGGWTKSGCYYAEDGSWSLAWRVHDAQFWGVPQRRKRIALVCDFGGLSAPEILFERKGLSVDSEPCGEEREGTAATTGGGAEGASKCKCMNPYDPQSERVFHGDGAWHSLSSNSGGGQSRDAIFCLQGTYPMVANTLSARHDGSPQPDKGNGANIVVQSAEPIPINTMIATRCKALGRGTGFGVSNPGNPAYTISAAHEHAVYVARGNGDGKTVCTITGDHENRVTDYTALCVGNGQANQSVSDKAGALNTMHDQQAVMVHAVVRRLTPLECERLQGYPEGWTSLNPISDMPDDVYAFWQNVLFEKNVRSGRIRQNEEGVWQIWRVKKIADPEGGDEKEDEWENTHKPYKQKTRKQMIAWYNRSFAGDSDSARYKALGNSIALPFWQWMAKRISAQYERTPTMASLFDGIGGFPLVFQRCGALPVWASEIEEFPIAVTKVRFPDESV